MSDPHSAPSLNSRERILARIRSANAHAHAAHEPATRDYHRSSTLAREEMVAVFQERLRDYDARIFPVHRGEIAARTAEVLEAAGRRRIVVPVELPGEWRAAGVEWIPDSNLSVDALNDVDGVMTAATVAVADSGSIALQHGPTEGRRVLTLLPDYHLCVLERSQVVATLPEAFARLDPSRPATFISGPSATADIEMERIKGVHGPRFLDVLLVLD